MTKRSWLYSLSTLALLEVAGCNRGDSVRLDALEKRVAALEARPTMATPPPRRPGPDPTVTYNLPVDDEDVFRGSKEAKVTIVEGFDFACPYCAMSAPIIDQLAERYKKDVKFVSKPFVVHPQIATIPALAVCAASRQKKGAEFERVLWTTAWKVGSAPNLDAEKLKSEAMEKLAGSVGLKLPLFKADVAGTECRDKIAHEQTQLSAIGVNGTPAFYINGRVYTGPRTVDGFASAIDQELKKADAAIASGIPLKDYYASLMKSAKTSL